MGLTVLQVSTVSGGYHDLWFFSSDGSIKTAVISNLLIGNRQLGMPTANIIYAISLNLSWQQFTMLSQLIRIVSMRRF